MAWRDDLLLDGKASFRGVEFLVKSSGRTVGRRTVVHEFPGKKFPTVEDMGAATGRNTLTAYVVGPSYLAERNELYKAFKKAGPGVLVHPYWGTMVVTVDGPVRINETPDEGGVARFVLAVVESGEETELTVTPDTVAEVEAAADAVEASVAEDFEDVWATSSGDTSGGVPVVSISEAVREAAQDLIDGVNGVVSVLNSVNGKINAVMNTVDAIGDAITALGDTAAAIILTPSNLANSIADIGTDLFESVRTVGAAWDSYFVDAESAGSIAGNPITAAAGGTAASGLRRVDLALSTFTELSKFGDDQAPVESTTPSRRTQSDNQDAFREFTRGSFVAEACRSVANMPMGSYDQAQDAQDALGEGIDALLDVASDESYSALVDLRAAVMRHLSSASAALPRVVKYTPAQGVPALVLAHRLYTDSTRDTDIIDRNDVRNPLSIPGGAELEVLTDV